MAIRRVSVVTPLRSSDGATLAPLRARELAMSIAGRARYLYELATGASAVDDGGATPLNPQGVLGVDLSGPPWGPAPRHPLWVYEGMLATSGVAGERVIHTFSAVDEVHRIVMKWRCRPHVAVRRDEPYTRAYLTLRYGRASGAGTATADVTLQIPGGATDYPRVVASGSLSTTSTETNTQALYVPQVPGENVAIVEVTQTSTDPIVLIGASLNNIVNRDH